jgi:anti-anti-sigma factor
MFIEIRQQYDGVCILHCEGSLGPGPEMEYMQAKLDELKKLAFAKLLVDFQHVTSTGSTGVTFIVGAYACVVRRPGGRFVLTGANPRVRHVLDLTRLSTVIPLGSDLLSGIAMLEGRVPMPPRPLSARTGDNLSAGLI